MSKSVSNPGCWQLANGTQISEYRKGTRCGSSRDDVTTCCYANDICMQDGICHFTDDLSNSPKTSGYYLGACTDESYTDPRCPKQCSEFPNPDIAYNATTDTWACCYINENSERDCNHPGSQTFQATPLSSLSPLPEVYGTSTSSSATRASTRASTPLSSRIPTSANPTAAAETTPASMQNSPAASPSATASGLSSGAKAGIGVGVAVGVILVALSIIFFFMRWRRRKTEPDPWRRSEEEKYMNQMPPADLPKQQYIVEAAGKDRRFELQSGSRSELGDGDGRAVELESDLSYRKP